MLTSSSPNSKLFEGSLSLKSSASDAASFLDSCKLESVTCPPAKFPEINNNNNRSFYDSDIRFLGTLNRNMTNPLGLTLKPTPESGVGKTNSNGNSRTRGGDGEAAKGGSRLDLIQAQFRQKLQSEKETKLREIFDKSVHDADRRIERITGGVGATSSRNVKSPTLMKADSRSVSSGGLMKEFFEERRDMEKHGSNNLTVLPNIQTHLKSKRRQYQQQQQQQQPSQIASESALKPPRYQHKRNVIAPILKPKLLSPIAPASEYQLEKSNHGEDSGGEGFNSTYSLSSSNLHPGDFPPSPGNLSLKEGGEASSIPAASKVHLAPVKTKKGRSPRREPASLSPREMDGAEEKTPHKMPRKAALAKRQQKAAAAAATAKAAAMEADNMKFLDKIIEAERRKSAGRRRRPGEIDAVAEKGAGDSKMTADTSNNSSKRREDEIMRQINQKMAELDRLRSQNKDLGDRSRGSSRGGTPVVNRRSSLGDDVAGENSSPDPWQGALDSTPFPGNQQGEQQQQQQLEDEERHGHEEEQRQQQQLRRHQEERQQQQRRREEERQQRGRFDVDVEEQRLKRVPSRKAPSSSPTIDHSRRYSNSSSPRDSTPVAADERASDKTPTNDVPPLRLGGGKTFGEQIRGGGVGFVAGEEGVDVNLRLVKCGNCDRQFAEDRLEKHEKVCRGQKDRKPFDTKKHRVAGQDHAAYALNEKYQKDQPKKESNWRAKREEFIQNIRYARLADKGKGGESLPPPPRAANPDYVQCPNCQRRFNQDAAERHIPRCKDLKTKGVGQHSANRNSSKTVSKPPSSTRRR